MKRIVYTCLMTIGFFLVEIAIGYGGSRLLRYFDVEPWTVVIALAVIVVPTIFLIIYHYVGDVLGQRGRTPPRPQI